MSVVHLYFPIKFKLTTAVFEKQKQKTHKNTPKNACNATCDTSPSVAVVKSGLRNMAFSINTILFNSIIPHNWQIALENVPLYALLNMTSVTDHLMIVYFIHLNNI